MTTAEEIWRNRTDDQVAEAIASLDEYTEEGRRIILAEADRRGLNVALPAEATACPPEPSLATLAVIDALKAPPKGTWLRQLGVLGISVLLFVSVGLLQWSAGEVAILIVVLLVHEAGHYLVMRGFGYRDVRMFFIPLLGAAVSGSGGRVPGYGRVLVALAGPGPGILVGLVLAVVAVSGGHPLVEYAAKVFLGLNILNLLPLLPFDGGHVIQETLFCRSRWLEAAFRFAGGAGILLLAPVTEGALFGLFGAFILISVPSSFKMGGVVQRLRGFGDLPDAGTPSEAPREFLLQVVEEVQRTFPSTKPARLPALVRTVFERLHPRPPGGLATILLLAAYGLFFVLAFIGIVVIAANEAPPAIP